MSKKSIRNIPILTAAFFMSFAAADAQGSGTPTSPAPASAPSARHPNQQAAHAATVPSAHPNQQAAQTAAVPAAHPNQQAAHSSAAPAAHPTQQAAPTGVDQLIKAGLEARNKKNYLQAINQFTEALSVDPNSLRAIKERALARRCIGDYNGAIEDYTKAIKLASGQSELYSHRGWCYARLGQQRAATSDFTKAIELDPENVLAYKHRGELKMKTGDYQGAMQDFNQVLVIDPDSAKELAQFFKPDFAKSLKGDLKKLATETSPSKQSHSTGTKPEDEGLSNREIARLNNDAAKAIRQGHFENAITILEKLARDFPKYDFARNNLSIAYNNQGLKVARREPQKSISQFRAALFYSPAEAAARRNLNSILVEQGMDPANYATRLSLGDTVKAQGDYRGAFVEYSEALRLKNTPELRHRLASVCVKLDGAAKDDSETEAGEHSAKAAGSLKAAGLNLVRRHSSTLATNSPTPHATPSAMTHPAHKKVIGREDLEQECKHLIESGSKNFNDGNYVEAQLDFERSITVARQLGQDTRLMADSLEKLAGIHIVRNNSHAATKALTEALRINEKLLPADDPIIEKTREKLETLHHRAEE